MKVKETGEKHISVPYCLTLIPCGLAWDQTWASDVREWRCYIRLERAY